MSLMRQALRRQTEVMVDTILGKGLDNHMLGLREMARKAGRRLPDIFTDESYVFSNKFTLSTSQVKKSLIDKIDLSKSLNTNFNNDIPKLKSFS